MRVIILKSINLKRAGGRTAHKSNGFHIFFLLLKASKRAGGRGGSGAADIVRERWRKSNGEIKGVGGEWVIIGHEWSAATPGVARRSMESSEMQRFQTQEYDFQSILDERQVGGNEGRNQLLNGIISVGGYRCRRKREKRMSHKYASLNNRDSFFPLFFTRGLQNKRRLCNTANPGEVVFFGKAFLFLYHFREKGGATSRTSRQFITGLRREKRLHRHLQSKTDHSRQFIVHTALHHYFIWTICTAIMFTLSVWTKLLSTQWKNSNDWFLLLNQYNHFVSLLIN